MKNLYLPYLLLASLTFFSCEDNNPVSPGIFSVTKISGTIKDWNSGTDKKIYFIAGYDYWNTDNICSSSFINSDGYFSLENLVTPDESIYMGQVYPVLLPDYQILRNTVICSDSSAKILYSTFAVIKAGDTSYTRLGTLSRHNNENSPPKTGDFFTYYVYVNKNVKINGTIEFIGNHPYSRWHNTYEYNLNYSKGWNKEVLLYKSYKGIETLRDTGYTSILISNTEPYGGYWKYTPWK